METNKDVWVEDRLASLTADVWEPNTAKGLKRFRHARQARRRSVKTAAIVAVTATAVAVSLLILPPTRLFAERCVNACLVQILHSRTNH